jgi:uncharacterized protein (DUF2147 family)
MRKVLAAAAALFVTLGAAGGAMAQDSSAGQLSGVWRNPKNTVHVRIQPCGGNVCGTVAWASAEARDGARRAGTPNLVGAQLFREFRRQDDSRWSGRVFVPDMNRTFSGSVSLQSRDAVVVRGCLIGRFLCKSQTWVRVS